MLNTRHEVEGGDNHSNTREKVNQLYKTKILELKDRFVDSLQDAPQVALELEKLSVITENQKVSIVSKPIRQHQKEALFYTIGRKDFEEIDLIISALQITNNESLRALLLLLKIKIWKECRFTRQDVQIKPVPKVPTTTTIDLDKDGEDNDIDDDKKFRISTFGPSHPMCIVPDSIPLKPVREDSADLKDDNDTLKRRIHQAASDGDVDSLQHWLKSTEMLPFVREPTTGRTPLHAAVLGKNSKAAFQCVELLIQRQTELLELNSENPRDQLASFLNHQCNSGNTVLHNAADNECVEIVKQLYDKYHCDAFIRNKAGLTPLDLMYIKTPEAILHLLNGALPTASSNHLSDGNLTLEIDFRTIIGTAHNCNNNNHHQGQDDGDKANNSHSSKERIYTETEMLAKLVHQNKPASKIILPHIIVKTFLDLKFQKLKMWLYTSMFLHILLHLWYTCFVVQVFLITCPHSGHRSASSSVKVEEQNSLVKNDSVVSSPVENGGEEENKRRNIFNYLFGDLESVKQVFSVYAHGAKSYQTCDLPAELSYQAYAFIVIGICFMIKEIYEVLLVKRVFANGASSEDGKLRKFFNGILAYLKSVENIFQLIFVFLMCGVSTLAFRSNMILDFYYSAASFSVVVAWALILMQVGNIYGLGTYVQILGKVIKSFATMMGTYVVLIVAFSIAFSIMFPQDKPFETLPKSLSRVIIMMTGELNYDETFYNDGDTSQVPIPLAGHIIYTSFVVMVTIILINLLIGLTVSDVQGLRGKSEVILRSIQVEQLYVMENTLLRLGWIFLLVKKLWLRLVKRVDSSKVYLDIFVIHPNDIDSIQGMVLKKSIKDIPKNLQRELRTLAGGADEYMKEYLHKYLS